MENMKPYYFPTNTYLQNKVCLAVDNILRQSTFTSELIQHENFLFPILFSNGME